MKTFLSALKTLHVQQDRNIHVVSFFHGGSARQTP